MTHKYWSVSACLTGVTVFMGYPDHRHVQDHNSGFVGFCSAQQHKGFCSLNFFIPNCYKLLPVSTQLSLFTTGTHYHIEVLLVRHSAQGSRTGVNHQREVCMEGLESARCLWQESGVTGDLVQRSLLWEDSKLLLYLWCPYVNRRWKPFPWTVVAAFSFPRRSFHYSSFFLCSAPIKDALSIQLGRYPSLRICFCYDHVAFVTVPSLRDLVFVFMIKLWKEKSVLQYFFFWPELSYSGGPSKKERVSIKSSMVGWVSHCFQESSHLPARPARLNFQLSFGALKSYLAHISSTDFCIPYVLYALCLSLLKVIWILENHFLKRPGFGRVDCLNLALPH